MNVRKPTAKNHIGEKVRRTGLKLTKQRAAICEVFFAQKGHQSAEEILQDVRMLDKNVSLATIYRTLKLLQEYGLANSHNFRDGQALFEPCHDTDDHHDHLICTQCGSIVEFFNVAIEKLQLRIAQAHGFLITDHKMELYGICSNCQSKRP